MIKEVRKLHRLKNGKSKANMIYALQARGAIGTYKSEGGYTAYDTEEYEAYKKNSRKGRPLSRAFINVKGEDK